MVVKKMNNIELAKILAKNQELESNNRILKEKLKEKNNEIQQLYKSIKELKMKNDSVKQINLFDAKENNSEI